MTAAYKQKLASSGLTLKDATQLGMSELTPKALQKLIPTAPAAPALHIPYYTITGKLRPKVFRVRLLAQVKGAFNSVSPLRYLQGAGTPPAAYFPRVMSWKDIAKDVGRSIVITEGELKAACACRNGFTCIGLGGVSSWRSARLNWEFLPELAEFDWKGRGVTICYDSDASTNPQVAAESARLGRALRERGAIVGIATLPEVKPGEKTGLDDYIVALGAEAFKGVIDAAESDELAMELAEFDGQYVYICEHDVIYDEHRRFKISPHRATTGALAHLRAWKVDGDKRKETFVVKEWMALRTKRSATRFTYKPGKPKMLGGDEEYNLWNGLAVAPKKGDVSLWHELLDFVLTDSNDIERKWFER